MASASLQLCCWWSVKESTGAGTEIQLVEPKSKMNSLTCRFFSSTFSTLNKTILELFFKAAANPIQPPVYSPHNTEGNRPLNAHIFEFSLVRVIKGLQQATERKEDKTYLQTVGWRTTAAERRRDGRRQTEERQLRTQAVLMNDFR